MKLSALGFGLVMAAVVASASPIGPVSTIPTAISGAQLAAITGGTLLGTTSGTLLYGGIGSPDIAGTWTEWAYNEGGFETFVVTFNVLTQPGGSSSVVEHFTTGTFSGWSLDGSYLNTSTAVPEGMKLTAGVVSFDFTGLNPGATETLIIRTNAPSTIGVRQGNLSLQNGTAINGIALVPGPEPMSLSLIGGGLALLGALRLRSKKA
jgi:hypothetical protein